VWRAASLWSRCVRGRRSGGARLWRRCVLGRGALVADRCESSVRESVSRLCELRPLRCGSPPAALCELRPLRCVNSARCAVELRPLRAVLHRFSWLPVWRGALRPASVWRGIVLSTWEWVLVPNCGASSPARRLRCSGPLSALQATVGGQLLTGTQRIDRRAAWEVRHL